MRHWGEDKLWGLGIPLEQHGVDRYYLFQPNSVREKRYSESNPIGVTNLGVMISPLCTVLPFSGMVVSSKVSASRRSPGTITLWGHLEQIAL